MKLSEVKVPFKINGREGNRVGFICEKCGNISNIVNQYEHFEFDYDHQFAVGICKKCGSGEVTSIWER